MLEEEREREKCHLERVLTRNENDIFTVYCFWSGSSVLMSSFSLACFFLFTTFLVSCFILLLLLFFLFLSFSLSNIISYSLPTLIGKWRRWNSQCSRQKTSWSGPWIRKREVHFYAFTYRDNGHATVSFLTCHHSETILCLLILIKISLSLFLEDLFHSLQIDHKILI